MTIQFKSDEVLDLFLYTGIELTEEQLKEKCKTDTLLKEVSADVFIKYTENYKQYVSSINYNFTDYIKRISSSLEKIKQRPDLIQKINEKLDGIVDKKIESEKSMGFVTKIFHKIGQLFKGHGFRTEGQWQKLQVAAIKNKLPGAHDLKFKKIQELIFHGEGLAYGETPPADIIQGEKFKAYVNSLSADAFQKLLNDVIFAQKETAVRFLTKKHRQLFFEGLSEEKKKVFYQELLKREDWLRETWNILEHDEGNLTSFINDEVLDKFVNGKETEQTVLRGESQEKFLDAMLSLSIKRMLAKNQFAEIVDLCKKYPVPSLNQLLRLDNQILDEKDRDVIKKNIQVAHVTTRDLPEWQKAQANDINYF